MAVVLRLLVRYVPWETEGRAAADHGDPAMVLRFLEAARELGLKYHFFVSEASAAAFPSLVDAALGEGHHVDVGPFELPELRRLVPGSPLRKWAEGLKLTPEADSILEIDPGEWGRGDSHLVVFRQLMARLLKAGHTIRTLRELTP